MLKSENNKFTDRLFPPGSASLYYSKEKGQQLKEIRWMRIEDLYTKKKHILYNRESNYKCCYNNGPLNLSKNMVIACNSLANSNRCL